MKSNCLIEMSILEYNEFIESLFSLKEMFCNLVSSKENLIYSSKEMSFIRDTIDVLFFSFASIKEESDPAHINENVPAAPFQNVLSNTEANSALTALERAIEKTRNIVDRM